MKDWPAHDYPGGNPMLSGHEKPPASMYREHLVKALNGERINPDMAWAILAAWDRFTDPEWWLEEFGRQRNARA